MISYKWPAGWFKGGLNQVLKPISLGVALGVYIDISLLLYRIDEHRHFLLNSVNWYIFLVEVHQSTRSIFSPLVFLLAILLIIWSALIFSSCFSFRLPGLLLLIILVAFLFFSTNIEVLKSRYWVMAKRSSAEPRNEVTPILYYSSF